jgi:hypothetical protein
LRIRAAVDDRFGRREVLHRRRAVGKCGFIGLEQYSSLVTSGRALVDLFDLNDRISFVAGALGGVPTPVGAPQSRRLHS